MQDGPSMPPFEAWRGTVCLLPWQLCERYARQLAEHTTSEARQLFPSDAQGGKMVASCLDDMAAFVDKAARQCQVRACTALPFAVFGMVREGVVWEGEWEGGEGGGGGSLCLSPVRLPPLLQASIGRLSTMLNPRLRTFMNVFNSNGLICYDLNEEQYAEAQVQRAVTNPTCGPHTLHTRTHSHAQQPPTTVCPAALPHSRL
jgi:hypothetical protein